MLLATNVGACQLVRLHIMFDGLLTSKERCYNSPTVGSGSDFLAIEEAWDQVVSYEEEEVSHHP